VFIKKEDFSEIFRESDFTGFPHGLSEVAKFCSAIGSKYCRSSPRRIGQSGVAEERGRNRAD
jgi:hypothetical protein